MSFSSRRLRTVSQWIGRFARCQDQLRGSFPAANLSSPHERCFSKKTKKTGKSTMPRETLAEIDDALSLEEAESRMRKSVEHLKAELANIRSGRAIPGMLDHMNIGDSTSGLTPLKALGTITVRDSHILSISLFDAASCPSVMTAIEASPLRLEAKLLNAQELLVTLPKQTQETLDALSKLVAKEAEHSKTSIRAARKVGMAEVKQLKSKDDQKRGEKEVDALTESYVQEIDALCQNKKRELRSS